MHTYHINTHKTMVLFKVVNLSLLQSIEQAMARNNCLNLKPGEGYQANFENHISITICTCTGPVAQSAPFFLITIFDMASSSADDGITRKSTMSLVADKESVMK